MSRLGSTDQRDSSEPYRYRAYGLSIRSGLAVPELDPSEADRADVTIRLRPIARPPLAAQPGSVFAFSPEAQYLGWSAIGGFLIRGGGEIDIDPVPGVGEGVLRLPLLGPVLAMLLHVRGLLVLHASAIAVANRGAVFLGDKEAGKSTIAAALLVAGHRLLADDVVGVDFSGSDGTRILPAFPHLKLGNGVDRAALDSIAVAMPRALPELEKRGYRLTERFSHEGVAPARIYILSRGVTAGLVRLPPHDAIGSLFRFSYLARFPGNALAGEAAGVHLKQCAALASSVAVSRLEIPSGLERLPEAVKLVESDLS